MTLTESPGNEKMDKIPCSIAIITSKADGLELRLKALTEFGEIIICHGNAPEENLEVARKLGAVIVKQYDTDEPLLNSMTDKAAVRQVAMDASTLPWRFFMDRDDALTPETIAEIRSITTDPNPPHLVWKMPSRIFIEAENGVRRVVHYATYPAYQTRLVHERVGARFRGLVHERLIFDERKFPVGTMHNSYDFHWSKQRVAHYWKYIGGYAQREIDTIAYTELRHAMYWLLYVRLRTIVGYVLWRLPKLYALHGMRDSVPLKIELLTVCYHIKILFGSIWRYIRSRVWCVLLFETMRGKDLNRTLTNIESRRFESYGRILDVGGGDGASSHWRFMKRTRWHRITTVDMEPKNKPSVLLNLEKTDLPFPPEHFETATLFNVLEHLNKRQEVLAQIHRVLKKDGVLIGSIPFLVNVHPDPNDFVRLTRQGLEKLFSEAGFAAIEIWPVGRGPLVASYYQSEFLWPRVLKLVILPMVLILDNLILVLRPRFREKFPLSYTFKVRK